MPKINIFQKLPLFWVPSYHGNQNFFGKLCVLKLLNNFQIWIRWSLQQFWAKNFKFQKHPPFLFPRQRRPYWTNRSRFYCINQLHLMQGVIPPSFIKICWAGNEKNEVEVFQTFTVSMATVAILKFFSWHCTPYHAGWHSCEVSLTWVHPPSRNVSDKNGAESGIIIT